MNAMLYLLTSILYILSFPNFNIQWLAWVCLIPLIIAIDKEKDVRVVGRNCLFCGWLIFLGGMHWLTKVTYLGYILVTFYMAWYIVLFGIIRFYNKNLWTVPLAWTSLEFIRGNLFGGIPWLLLGASQYNFLPLIQISNITGVYGVSFIVALVNAQGQSLAIYRYRMDWSLFITVLILLITLGYGRIMLNRHEQFEKIKIGIVQPNVSQDVKWDPEYTDWMLNRLEGLTMKVGNADFVVWPETSVPTLTHTPGLLERIKGLRTNLLLGSQGIEDGRYYNSAFFIQKDGRLLGEYRKIHLVPFGEFVPFGDIFPFLKKFTPIIDGFTPGKEFTVFKPSVINYELSTIICFEDIFPDLTRRFVRNGARVLVNITNDGWFGESAEVYQHAYLSVFRAVENCVPLVRATNTGLSCFVDYTGKMYSLKPFIETSGLLEMLVPKRNTFYTMYGDIFSWLCIIILFGGGIYVRRVKKATSRD